MCTDRLKTKDLSEKCKSRGSGACRRYHHVEKQCETHAAPIIDNCVPFPRKEIPLLDSSNASYNPERFKFHDMANQFGGVVSIRNVPYLDVV